MARQSKLIALPAAAQHLILSLVPDFYDLGALILTHRSFYDIFYENKQPLLATVARNLLGSLFDEAILLARAQERCYGLGDPKKNGFSSNRILLLVNNDYILRSLERVSFALLKSDERFDTSEAESLVQFVKKPYTRQATLPESLRFLSSGYKFWRYALLSEKGRTPYLKKLRPSELFELNHFVDGISNLIYAMRGVAQESDHDLDFISGVLSTGPENILNLWDAKQRGAPEFEMELESAGCLSEEGFWTYPYMEATEELNKIDKIAKPWLEPILDGENEKMHKILVDDGIET
ncbi:hypothetical protein R3P38DRAFT_3250517 [Favolaschia claudopus]|uniref:F-box domain-containing protein n=1 Tax=Favolaschia claudopus TaxID=2862362 RepID=A0AAW0EK99_9AGAR